MPETRIILIAGPTASGKSALALALAERFGGIIINADSMQVYRELRVLTARPTTDEEARAPHRLFGTVPGATAYSSGQWLAAASWELSDALAAGRPAIVVGGTGLYFKALPARTCAGPRNSRRNPGALARRGWPGMRRQTFTRCCARAIR